VPTPEEAFVMSAVLFGDEVMPISRFHDQRDDLNAERSSSLRS
jgi:hypothetical protein